MKLSPKLETVLIALLWLALTGLALVMAYVIGSVIVWLIQQAIVTIGPVVVERPALAGSAILALSVALGAIGKAER